MRHKLLQVIQSIAIRNDDRELSGVVFGIEIEGTTFCHIHLPLPLQFMLMNSAIFRRQYMIGGTLVHKAIYQTYKRSEHRSARVCLWHLADMTIMSTNVRFWDIAQHWERKSSRHQSYPSSE